MVRALLELFHSFMHTPHLNSPERICVLLAHEYLPLSLLCAQLLLQPRLEYGFEVRPLRVRMVCENDRLAAGDEGEDLVLCVSSGRSERWEGLWRKGDAHGTFRR